MVKKDIKEKITEIVNKHKIGNLTDLNDFDYYEDLLLTTRIERSLIENSSSLLDKIGVLLAVGALVIAGIAYSHEIFSTVKYTIEKNDNMEVINSDLFHLKLNEINQLSVGEQIEFYSNAITFEKASYPFSQLLIGRGLPLIIIYVLIVVIAGLVQSEKQKKKLRDLYLLEEYLKIYLRK